MPILEYLQFAIGRLLYPIRAHDSRQLIYWPAFQHLPEPNMTLESDCGPSGSSLPLRCSMIAKDRSGALPELHWSAPESTEPVKEYMLVCEDIDIPIPFMVIHHGLFWAIPAPVTAAMPEDVQPHEDADQTHRTKAGWRFLPNIMSKPYIGAGAPLGHGSHRYVFTIIALNTALEMDAPEKVTKQEIKQAMEGKIIGWGQWTGVFERPWPT
ncbi:Phosphatidylethanolamine-binding protein PEBP [Penicillium lagena]|uniref:Phosphatidylethanolamine-binding protein PEBP n=1 Tax=Penicillium lagena TaxID=94218 RepID=UPI002541AD8B|nr:Phosphatidylethanolamine-binding protein PEBP [Penicillium lagena]KAJ5625336.1 Phosphatidylethanolamine-binding protein PEBP [Penicillium lagena]